MAGAPHVQSWNDLTLVSEEPDPGTGIVQYTMFAVLDGEEQLWYGQLDSPKSEISFDRLNAALERIEDQDIFPEIPSSSGVEDVYINREISPTNTETLYYIKRPQLIMIDFYKQFNAVYYLSKAFLHEALVMEELNKHPHPNIIAYHGCRVRRGRITGLYLDRHTTQLETLKKEQGTNLLSAPAKENLLTSLSSAINHLHSIGWAHNDLNPSNILLNAAGEPVLIDFGSAQKIGDLLGSSRGTKGWIEGEMKDYTHSKRENDLFALGRLREWMDEE